MLNIGDIEKIMEEDVFNSLWVLLGKPEVYILDSTIVDVPAFRGGGSKSIYIPKCKVPCLFVSSDWLDRRYISEDVKAELYLRRSDIPFRLTPIHRVKYKGEIYTIRTITEILETLYLVTLG